MAIKHSFQLMFIGLLLTVATSLFAQSSQKVMKQVANKACTCMEKLDMDIKDKAGYVQLETIMEKCLQDAMLSNLKKIAKAYDMDFSNNTATEAFGTELAITLLANCDPFIEYSILATEYANEDTEKQTEAVEEKSLSRFDKGDKSHNESRQGITTGTLNGFTVNNFVIFSVTDSTGNENAFLWLHNFDGSRMFIEDMDSYKGKTVEVQWREYYAYSPAEKIYLPLKEIVALKILD